MIRFTPKLVREKKIWISMFSKRVFQQFWFLAKWRPFLIKFFIKKWQKRLKIGFNMVTILPKIKILKIPSLKTQILIISTSKPNLVSIWPPNEPKKSNGVQKLSTFSTKRRGFPIYFATSRDTHPYISIRKISNAQPRKAIEHILETRNIGEQHITKQKKKYFLTTDLPLSP